MIAAVILCVSIAAMLQFFISYCRSLIAASARQPLSAETQDVTGIPNRVAARSKDFLRVTQLLQLCPERPNDRGGIRSVQFYFRLLKMSRKGFGWMIPSLRPWTEMQGAQCAYYVAVALDRRIAFSRDVVASQINLT
jgi:hypothetical protein